MKNLVLLLLATGTLAACSAAKQDEPAPVPQKFVAWTVDGQTTNTAGYVTGTGGSGQFGATAGATVRVGGRVYSGGSPTAQVDLEVPPVVGTYTFGPASPAWGTYQAGAAKYYAGTAPGQTAALGSGTIVVTEFTGSTLRGTFSFTGIDPGTGAAKTIANGSFYVPE